MIVRNIPHNVYAYPASQLPDSSSEEGGFAMKNYDIGEGIITDFNMNKEYGRSLTSEPELIIFVYTDLAA